MNYINELLSIRVLTCVDLRDGPVSLQTHKSNNKNTSFPPFMSIDSISYQNDETVNSESIQCYL